MYVVTVYLDGTHARILTEVYGPFGSYREADAFITANKEANAIEVWIVHPLYRDVCK